MAVGGFEMTSSKIVYVGLDGIAVRVRLDPVGSRIWTPPGQPRHGQSYQ